MRLGRLAASGCGVGFLPVAPGTLASLLALAPGLGLMLLPVPVLRVPVLGLAVLAASLGGLWAIRACRAEGDPSWVVIDEVAGQWTALLGLARPSAAGLAAAFLIFRLLDVAKPGPVGWADRQPGAAGVMADDLIAGALTAGILWAARSRWPGVFG
jgi:phosphatidylglycerophosphatase A